MTDPKKPYTPPAVRDLPAPGDAPYFAPSTSDTDVYKPRTGALQDEMSHEEISAALDEAEAQARAAGFGTFGSLATMDLDNSHTEDQLIAALEHSERERKLADRLVIVLTLLCVVLALVNLYQLAYPK